MLSVTPGMTALDTYDAAIRLIAEESPVRICPEEKNSGAATLGAGIDLLPYHPMGQGKWESLGLADTFDGKEKIPTEKDMEMFREAIGK